MILKINSTRGHTGSLLVSTVMWSRDESAGVQNAAIMWAVVPPGGSTGGSWLLVVLPGGRTCSILSEEIALVQIFRGPRFIFKYSRSLRRMTNIKLS